MGRPTHAFSTLGAVALVGLSALLAGCANEAKGGDPGARPLPPGASCQSLKGEMDGLVRRGVPGFIERRQSGGKLTPAQNADADRYNELLSYYLGGRCHA